MDESAYEAKTTAARELAIPSAVDHLRQVATRLSERVDQLGHRLQPIRRPIEPHRDAIAKLDVVASTPLADDLMGLCSLLTTIDETALSILDSIEV